MNRMTTLLAGGLVSAIGFTSVAFADTTIYGSVRSGIYHLDSDGGKEATWDLGSVDAGDLDSGDKLWSRIGVRASHEINNGMTGGLHIEKRLDDFRTRHQNVWLQGAFGRVTLGQQGNAFHSAVSWDGTNLFGNWLGASKLHGGSRGQGIKYSSMLDGPFSFEAMVRDDNSFEGKPDGTFTVMEPDDDGDCPDGTTVRGRDNRGNNLTCFKPNAGSPDGSGQGFDQYELTASFSMADVATVSAGYLGRAHGKADVFGGSVGGSAGGVSWKVGYEKDNADNSQSNYGAFLGYAGAYVFYEDYDTENNTDENDYLVFGYSHSLGTNTKVIIEHQRPDEGQNRTALALRVDF